MLDLKTIQQFNHDYQNRGNRRNQSHFQNFVNPPILSMDPDKRIIEVLHIPSLHLLLGVVDKLLQELEKKVFKNWIDKYLKRVNIVIKSYQGQHSLEGNQCSEFLKKLDILERELMKESTGLIVVTLPIL